MNFDIGTVLKNTLKCSSLKSPDVVVNKKTSYVYAHENHILRKVIESCPKTVTFVFSWYNRDFDKFISIIMEVSRQHLHLLSGTYWTDSEQGWVGAGVWRLCSRELQFNFGG